MVPDLIHVISSWVGGRRGQLWLPNKREPRLEDYKWLYNRINSLLFSYRVPMDIVQVCNGVPEMEDSVSYLPCGTFTRYGRKNEGISFGAFNDAYTRYRTKYEYYFFIEDDVYSVDFKYEEWIVRAVEILDTRPEVGFVGLLGRVIQGAHWERDYCHVHGGCGIARTEALEKVFLQRGSLPHPTVSTSEVEGDAAHCLAPYEAWVQDGEVAFSNAVWQLGYVFANVPGFVFDWSNSVILKEEKNDDQLFLHEPF